VPTIARIGPYRFFFFSDEGREPPHVHVESGDGAAKFWLGPVRLARTANLGWRDLSRMRALVIQHEAWFRASWRTHFGR
jgi:hypothetical protein